MPRVPGGLFGLDGFLLSALIILASIGIAGLASVSQALTYVDASPSGPAFPEWEGGDTELEFADWNADGNIDFASIGDHGSPYVNTNQHGVMVYFSNGAGGWSIHMEGNFGYGGIAAGDVNNDGFLDVGYGMHHDYSGNDFGDQLIEVALGNGTGFTWTPWDDGLGQSGEDWGMFATDFGDIDEDGDLDLVSNSFGASNGVHVYRNNGDGTWTQTWARTGGNARQHVCFGDVNGDGHLDIASAYQYGTIWLGDGQGLFTAGDTGLPSPGTLGLKGPSLGDVNGDGWADLAFALNGGVQVYVWTGSSWVSSSTGLPTSGVYAITHLWDMNGDGFLDVAALGDGILTVWLGDGAGHWTSAGNSTVGPGIETQAFEVGGDIDHNGRADAAVLQEEGSYPNYQNHLYVMRESTPALARAAGFQFPLGNEVFYIGSVRTIRWWAAHVGTGPATIRLELSRSGPGGPYELVADGLPDSGHYQWNVSGPATGAACLRATLTQAGESVSAVGRTFRILPSGSMAAPERGGALLLRVAPNPVLGDGPCVIFAGGASIPAPARVGVRDCGGRLVRVLACTRGQARWDGCDAQGNRVPTGVYWISLFDDGEPGVPTRRVTLLR
jgi:hypothetical protein